MVTTASKISPLNGLKRTHLYFTGKVTKPVPSLIKPSPTLSMSVTATTNPFLPLQKIPQKEKEKRKSLFGPQRDPKI